MSEETEKVFGLKRVEDPQTKLILQTRKACQRMTTLTFAARLFFDMLLDLALDPMMNFGRRGQVRVGQKKLAFWIGASRRSITEWKRELIGAGFVWMSKHFMPDKDAMDVYHIAALDPQHNDEPTTNDAFYGNGYRRHWPMEAGKGARGMVRKKVPILFDQFEKPVHSSFYAQNVDAQSSYGKNLTREAKQLRLTGEKSSQEMGKTFSCEAKELRPTTENSSPDSRNVCASQPKNPAAGNGKKPTSNIESEIEKETIQIKGEGNPPAFKQWEPPKNAFPSTLEKLRREFDSRLKSAKSATAKAEYKRRIKLVDEILLGPEVPDDPQPKPGPARKAPETVKQPTDEELAESFVYLTEAKKTKLITPAMRQAWERRQRA